MTNDRGQPHTANGLRVTDFTRSFVRIRIDLKQIQPKTISQPPPFTLNNCRFPLECRCRVTRGEGTAARSVDYVFGASCKAEQVHVRENIWHEPAADWLATVEAHVCDGRSLWLDDATVFAGE